MPQEQLNNRVHLLDVRAMTAAPFKHSGSVRTSRDVHPSVGDTQKLESSQPQNGTMHVLGKEERV